jgi:perosamine synthetase
MEALNTPVYVPEMPTLFPSMLLGSAAAEPHWPPFDHDNVHWFYFARNAVWNSVRMLGLEGGEVLVPSYHHGVEIEALEHAGATPVFYRVGGHWDVDIEDVARRIGPRTRALYLTHYAGFPGPVREMKRLAEQHGLPLIEDCALSLLSADHDLKLGTVGDIGIFCLYKTLPVPNGGALVVNGPQRFHLPTLPPPPTASVVSHTASSLLKNIEMRGGRLGRWARSTVRSLASGAVKAGQVERVATGTMHFDPAHVELGISPLTMRISQSLDLDHAIEVRRRNYLYLLGQLGPLSRPLFPTLPPGVCPLFYPVVTEHKPQVLEALWAAGVEAVDFWRDHHPLCDPAEFPDTMAVRHSIVEVPCHQDIDESTIAQVARIVRETLERHPDRRRSRLAARH